MEKFYDVAIIGGGPAGSSAATYLARMNYNVAVFEKEKFPREHVGESLIPFCYYRLKELDVLDDIRKFATKKPGINFITSDGTRESVWCFERVLTDGAGMIYHTSRAEFDKALLDNAAKNGVSVFEEHAVKNVDLQDEEVRLTIRNSSGEENEVRARFLLDASGQHSFLAKKLNVKKSYEGLDRVAFYRRWFNNKYDKALNAGLIKIVYLGGEKKGWIWVIPIGRNYLSIGVSLNNDYVKQQRPKFSGENWRTDFYMNEISEATCLREILENSVPAHEAYSIGDYSYYTTQKFGKNYALIGDAGAFLDPIFSSGLFAALETAKRVSAGVDTFLTKGTAEGEQEMQAIYREIEAGYKLIEKFVRLFYDPSLLNFAHSGSDDPGYEKFTRAYNVFHYLLAGDFFSNHRVYSEFLDTLYDERAYNKFLHYVKSRTGPLPFDTYCGYEYEDIYGHLPPEGR